MRAGLLQTCVGDLPSENIAPLRAAIRQAVAGGAGFVLTPEATNCLSASRSHQAATLTAEDGDPVLAMLRDEAARAGIWLLAGSLILKTADPDGRFANRSLLIGPDGGIAARYDKIHLFDVQVSDTETYRESAGIRPGGAAVLAQTPFAAIGMTVCYVLAPAQTGTHPASTGRSRSTHGHAMAVAPWGEVLADAGTEPGVIFAELDLSQVTAARSRVPALSHDRPYSAPGETA